MLVSGACAGEDGGSDQAVERTAPLPDKPLEAARQREGQYVAKIWLTYSRRL
jgi:hypothetical protein